MRFSPEVIRRYLADARRATTTDAQGKIYEELVVYLFELIPGSYVERNITGLLQTEQVDVAVGHPATLDGLHLLPRIFLVECKNWTRPVDSSTLGYFMNILAGRGVELGVLVAANGITGSREELLSAHALGLHGSPRGIKVLVITDDDLAGLETLSGLVELLHRRYLRAFATGGIGAP